VWHQGGYGGFYYGVFNYSMPDLNLNNPVVKEEIKKITRFWLVDIGVDGFRLDGVRHYIEDGKVQVNTKATHQWVADFSTYVKSIKPDAFLVGEIWDGSELVAAYLNKNELDMAFDFDLAESWVGSISSGDGRGIAFTQKYDNDLFKNGNYATFLTNHDMNRVMSQFAGDVKKARIASTLLLTSPGTPFIYYGEEVGMKGEKPDENIRLPMPWNSDKNAGFTTGKPWLAGNVDPGGINVAAQNTDPASVLSIYRDLIRLRMSSPALSGGKFYSINTDSPNVIAYLRIAKDDAYLVIANLDMKTIGNYRFSAESIPLKGSFKLTGELGAEDGKNLDINEEGRFKDFQPYSELAPMSVYIFKLNP
jgi:glycosidase